MKVRPGASVLVLGLGGVGVSVVRGATLAGAEQIIAVDRNADKEEIARAAGATTFALAGDGLRKSVKGLTNGRGTDYAFGCVGSAGTIRDAWSLTRRGGAACVVGIGSKDEPITLNPLELFYFARSLTGCVAGSLERRRRPPDLGTLDLAQMVTGHGTLDDAGDALNTLGARQGTGRCCIPTNSDVLARL